jgi:hypothetical protein
MFTYLKTMLYFNIKSNKNQAFMVRNRRKIFIKRKKLRKIGIEKGNFPFFGGKV